MAKITYSTLQSNITELLFLLKTILANEGDLKSFSKNDPSYIDNLWSIKTNLLNLSELIELDTKSKQAFNSKYFNDIFSILRNIKSDIYIPSSINYSANKLSKYIKIYNNEYYNINNNISNKEYDNYLNKSKELDSIINQIKSKEDEINIILNNIQKKEEVINNNTTELNNKNNTINNFINELSKYKTNSIDLLKEISNNKTNSELTSKKINELQNKINIDYIDKLNELNKLSESYSTFIDEYKDKLQKLESELRNKITESQNLLSINTSRGLSSSFSAEIEKIEKSKYWYWIIGSALFLSSTVLVGVWIIVAKEPTLPSIIGRLAITPFTIAGAIFCANQYIRAKNLLDDYSYKRVIATSLVGFSDQLKDNTVNSEEYRTYIRLALEQIHQDPLRKRPRVSKDVDGGIKNGIDYVLETAQKVANLTKPLEK